VVLLLAACSSDDASAPPTQEAASIGATASAAVIDDAPSGEEPLETIGAAEPTAVEEPGSIGSKELPAVGVGEVVELDDGVDIRVTSIRDVTIEAQGPGEVSGPGTAVQVEIGNGSGTGLNLSGVTVSLIVDGDPGVPSFSAPHDPFVGELAPGGRATATYAFLGGQDAGEMVVRVEYNDSENVAVVVR
jgi:hypothetical protein